MNPKIFHPRAGIQSPTDSVVFRRGLFFALVIGVCIVGVSLFASRPSDDGCRVSINHSNLRQIGQASMIYASDSQDRLPQTVGIYAFAFELARRGGLNDATVWIASTESNSASGLSTVLSSDHKTLHPAFAAIRPSIAAAVRGLHAKLPSTTPIAWTRGLQPDGTWSKHSPYGSDGGHIVFLGGNVSWFRDLKQPSNTLFRFDGQGTTTDIRAALPPDAVIANN